MFVNGISRFVLFVGAFAFLVIATIIDMILNIIQLHLEQKTPYHILVLGHDDTLGKRVAAILGAYRIYQVDLLTDQYIEPSYDMVVVAGKMALPLLQDVADTARIQGQRFYHVGDELFLEDLIAHPQRLGPLMALEYTSSPLNGRRRVIKRLFDIG